MAVSVNTVYQTILALANKEQRGYITPQEFNLFANQAQMDIYEQYFYDLNQFRRGTSSHDNSTDPVAIIHDKLSNFAMFSYPSASVPSSTGNKKYTLPTDFYRYIDSFKKEDTTLAGTIIEKVTKKDFFRVARGPLTKATSSRPILYFDEEDRSIWISGFPAFSNSADSQISFSYYRVPKVPKWAYLVVNEKPFYNSQKSTNFELHSSEQKNLILKILNLAGISIKDYSLTQAAQVAEGFSIQNQKS